MSLFHIPDVTPEQMADVLHDHNVVVDIHENILTPGHEPRTESPQYAKVHKHLVKELDLPCIVCGVRNSTLKDPVANRFKAKLLETHHRYIEWSLMNAVDLDKFNSRLLRFLRSTHPDEPLYQKPFDRPTLSAWVDHHPHNLWVICDVHHVGRNTGIHYLAMPIWGVQDLLLDQYQQQVMKMLLAPHGDGELSNQGVHMNQVSKVLYNIKNHLPAYAAVAIVVVSALQDQGVIHLSNNLVTLINAVLAACGLGVLHLRQQAQAKGNR